MPTCPGCQQCVQYDQLDTHERYCRGLRDPDAPRTRTARRLENRLEALDRRIEQRLSAVEDAVQGYSPPEEGDVAEGLRLLERDG